MDLKSEKLKVYVPNDKYVWLACDIVSEISHGEYSISITDEDAILDNELKANFKVFKELPGNLVMQNIEKSDTGVDDMCSLNYLHEASILHNLRRRFASKLPYTYVGNICIAVNPYQWLKHLYSDDCKNLHSNHTRSELPPHVYGTSATAYKELRDLNKNQSILVSGESGAGKTETVKILMAHLAHISSYNSINQLSLSDKHIEVIEKVLQSNPLLESFGNAKTARNDNSSRFGKFTQLQFDSVTNILVGSRCITYLLEKSRVITQNDRKERNYHIFHQMFASFETIKEKLFHDSTVTMRDFRFTCNGDTHTSSIEGVSDSRRYLDTMKSLDLLGVNDTERFQLQCIIVGILYLGQIVFYGDNDSSYIDPAQSDILTKCCELLGLEVNSFCEKTTIRTIDVAGEEMIVHLSREQASDARDALAKDIYERLFLWLVNVINNSTCNTEIEIENEKTISLLDIFGFESFQINRFEQLNINYANEKLQQKFVSDVFSSVQVEYREEGLDWEMITFQDNSDILELLEGKNGVFSLLNEECNVPQGNDMKYLTKLLSSHQKSVHLSQTVHMSKDSFSIIHYAGKVTYKVEGFVERNKDNLPSEMKSLMLTSSNDIISSIFSEGRTRSYSGSDSVISFASTSALSSIDTASAVRRPVVKRHTVANSITSSIPATTTGSKKSTSYLKAESVTTKFKAQLSSLMDTISKTNVQYVRCIKPNSNKSATQFNRLMVVEQLRCAGMIEAIRISRAAYPYRLTHHEFIGRFGNLLPKRKFLNEAIARRCDLLLKELLPHTQSITKSYEVGKSKIYFSSGTLELLENVRGKLVKAKTIIIQKYYRRYLSYTKYIKTLKLIKISQSVIRKFIKRKKYLRIKQKIIIIQCCFRKFKASKIFMFLRKEKAITKIQNWLRMKKLRNSFILIYEKIKYLQSVLKTFVCRKRYVQKITLLRREKDLNFQIENLKLKLLEEENNRIKLEEENRIRLQHEKELLELQIKEKLTKEFENLQNEMKEKELYERMHLEQQIRDQVKFEFEVKESSENVLIDRNELEKQIREQIRAEYASKEEKNTRNGEEIFDKNELEKQIREQLKQQMKEEFDFNMNESKNNSINSNGEFIFDRNELEKQIREQIKAEYEAAMKDLVSPQIPVLSNDDVITSRTSKESSSDSFSIKDTSGITNEEIIDDNINKEKDKIIENLQTEIKRLNKKLAYLEQENKAVKVLLADAQNNDQHELEIDKYKKQLEQNERIIEFNKADISKLYNQINNYKIEKTQMLETWNHLSSELEIANKDKDNYLLELTNEKQLRVTQGQLTLLFLTSKGLDPNIVQELKAMYDTMNSAQDVQSKQYNDEKDDSLNVSISPTDQNRKLKKKSFHNYNLDYESSIISSVSTHRSPEKMDKNNKKKSKSSPIKTDEFNNTDNIQSKEKTISNDLINKNVEDNVNSVDKKKESLIGNNSQNNNSSWNWISLF